MHALPHHFWSSWLRPRIPLMLLRCLVPCDPLMQKNEICARAWTPSALFCMHAHLNIYDSCMMLLREYLWFLHDALAWICMWPLLKQFQYMHSASTLKSIKFFSFIMPRNAQDSSPRRAHSFDEAAPQQPHLWCGADRSDWTERSDWILIILFIISKTSCSWSVLACGL